MYLEADFIRFYGKGPFGWGWREFINLLTALPVDASFHVWWKSVSAEEGGRVNWWQSQMAEVLPTYTNADRVMSFDQFTGSSLQEDVLGE